MPDTDPFNTPDPPAIPRPEHPRPDFYRSDWRNLNGMWRFTFDPKNEGEQIRWHRVTHPDLRTTPAQLNSDPFGDSIVVPFPWESQLSTIEDTEYKGAAWYQRVIEVPADWAESDAGAEGSTSAGLSSAGDSAASTSAVGANVVWKKKPFLCFGAVDWSAKVWVDGKFVGEHYGGYTPFDLDLSQYVRPGKPATLTVRVWDACDADTPLGKQTYDWYTPSGGIWQTVYLEGRPETHITQIHVTPNADAGEATFVVTVAGGEGKRYRVEVLWPEEGTGPNDAFEKVEAKAEGSGTVTLTVRVPNAKLWSPEEPNLYDAIVRLHMDDGTNDARNWDGVRTYFGLRKIGRGFWQDNPYEFVFLNGEPVYLRGALDQAFTPDGLHAYPSDDAIRADIQTAKDMGLNMIRCHIKVNEPRYYYWADKLGLLVMYDLPSASVYTPTARKNWEETFRAAFARDYSHPSIMAWILFNETWGLEEHATPTSWNWVREMFDLAKSMDATRLVEDNSACLYDHVKTDLNTWHFYISDYDRARHHCQRVIDQTYPGSGFNYVSHRYPHVSGGMDFVQGTEPLMNSEYAGLSASGGDKDISYSFKFLTSELRRHDKCCGYVYTELTDLEWEHNGFVNYDRSAKEYGYEAFFPGMTVADLNGADFVGLDCPPCQTLAPGSTFAAPVFVSHWDKRQLQSATLKSRVLFMDRFGETRTLHETTQPITPRRYGVLDGGECKADLPNEDGLATVQIWLEDAEGNVRARNYINVDVSSGSNPMAFERTEHGFALRFEPGQFADSSYVQPQIGDGGSKFGAGGAGYVEYALSLPPDFDVSRVTRLRLRFEAGARSSGGRVGWKKIWHGYPSHPQTEARKIPSDLVVTLNGQAFGKVRLTDDPADARGVLSAHLSGEIEYASYGFLTDLTAPAGVLDALRTAHSGSDLTVRFTVPRNGKANGLNLYGARNGAFPVSPTLFLDTE